MWENGVELTDWEMSRLVIFKEAANIEKTLRMAWNLCPLNHFGFPLLWINNLHNLVAFLYNAPRDPSWKYPRHLPYNLCLRGRETILDIVTID